MIKEYIVAITNDVIPDGFERFEDEYSPERELVRCKDCTYRGEINCPQYYRRTELSDDYFCADGELER